MSRASGRDLIVLAVATALLFAVGLGARDLWNPNEPLYGQAVVEMREAGDWHVPRVNGEIFGEKPILYFWLALAAAEAFGGVDEWTLRLPSVAAGVALVLLTYLLVLPYSGRQRAWIAAALVATTYIVFWSARQVQMDLLLATCCLGAIVPVTRLVDHGAREWFAWSLAGGATGLGFLAKGPVGVILPALALALYLGSTRRWRAAFSPAVLAAVVSFLVVGAPWYLWLAFRGETTFLGEVLYRQNVERFVAPWDHQAPFWYYLKYFWLDMLPWSPFLPVAIGLRATDENERRLHRLAWVWLVGLIVFFSLSASKRSPYILPAAPALAVLVSGVLDRWWGDRLDRRRRALGQAIVAAFGMLFLVAAYLVGSRAGEFVSSDPGLATAGRAAAGLVAAGGVVVLAGLIGPARKSFRAVVALATFVALIYLFATVRLLPAIDPYKSHRAMSEEIRRHVSDMAPLRGFHDWRWRAGYSYYTGRPIPYLASLEELRGYWSSSEEVFVVVERGALERARGVIGPAAPLASREIGSNAAYLFSNRQGSGGE